MTFITGTLIVTKTRLCLYYVSGTVSNTYVHLKKLGSHKDSMYNVRTLKTKFPGYHRNVFCLFAPVPGTQLVVSLDPSKVISVSRMLMR